LFDGSPAVGTSVPDVLLWSDDLLGSQDFMLRPSVTADRATQVDPGAIHYISTLQIKVTFSREKERERERQRERETERGPFW
jgi:hypothetical protein